MNSSSTSRLAALMLCLLVPVAAGALPPASGATATPPEPETPLPSPSPVDRAPFDLLFLDLMIRQQQMGVEMARKAELRAERPEIRQLGATIAHAQQMNIDLLMNWQTQWYAGQVPAAYHRMQGSVRNIKYMQIDMRQLDSQTRQAFDVMFLQLMTRHHRSTIKMARQGLRMVQHDELRQLITRLMDEQERQIRVMEHLLQ